MNEGLKAWCARLALIEMDANKCNEWWCGGELLTRWECERQLGVNDE